MKFTKSVFVLITAAVFIAACAEAKKTVTDVPANTAVVAVSPVSPASPSMTPDAIAASKSIFLETCAGCHRENGEGGAAEFEGKKIKVPSYRSKGAMNASDEKLYNYIANGEENEMPAFKDKLTEEQMRNLVKFIRRDFQNK